MEAVGALFSALSTASEFKKIAGLATLVLILNVLLHTFKEWFNRRSAEKAEDSSVIKRELRPLLAATTDLVARLLELLIQPGSRLQRETWTRIEENASLDIPLSRYHSTTVRLVAFLALRERFRQNTAHIESRELDRIRFYLDRKIPASLKGNIFSSETLSTEDAEVIGEFFAPPQGSRQFTMYGLLEKLSTDQGRRLFNHAGERLKINVEVLKRVIEDHRIPESKDANRVLALAHFALMLSDFQQDVQKSAHWEENRIVLCKFIVKHNITRDKKTFLYSHGDLSGDYLDTFGPYVAPLATRIRYLPFKKVLLARALRSRGKVEKFSHPTKIPSKGGVLATQGSRKVDLKWEDDLAVINGALTTFLASTRKIVSLGANVDSEASA